VTDVRYRLLCAAFGAAAVGLCCYGGAAAGVVAIAHHPARTRAAGPPAPTAMGPGEALASWYSGGGRELIDTMTVDLRAVGDAAHDGHVTGIRAACLVLRGHVSEAQAYRPIPEPVAQSAWTEALTDYAAAASDCAAGTDRRDPALLRRANDEMVAGGRAEDRVTARVTQLADS